jgi:hypothetical protein
VARAVESVLAGTRSPVRVTVVCHNTEIAAIESLLAHRKSDSRLRLAALNDGVPSPSGPFNEGLRLASAPFISILGSDDELEPGAIDSWLEVADRDSADIVIARLEFSSGKSVSSPPTRPGRTARLDGVRDRLSYRSAPLGLVSRERFGQLRLMPGMRNGGDIAYVTRLWFSDARISFDRGGPAYVINDDSDDRVTFARKPVAAELEWLFALVKEPWIQDLTSAQRAAVATKLARAHLFGAVYNRRDLPVWSPEDRVALLGAVGALGALSPDFARVLSRADGRLLEAIRSSAPTAELVRLAMRRRRVPRVDTMLTRQIRLAFARDAPLRLAAASLLTSRSRKRALPAES